MEETNVASVFLQGMILYSPVREISREASGVQAGSARGGGLLIQGLPTETQFIIQPGQAHRGGLTLIKFT